MVRYIHLWLLDRFGEDGLKRVLARLSPGAKAVLEKPVPHEWYPVALSREIYEKVEAEFIKENPDTFISLGSFIAEHSVKGFLMYMIRLISVETAITRLQAIWNRYHKGGTAKANVTRTEGKKKEGLLTVENYDAGEQWCKMMDGYTRTFLESIGAKNVSCKKRFCIHHGDDVCSWEVSWE